MCTGDRDWRCFLPVNVILASMMLSLTIHGAIISSIAAVTTVVVSGAMSILSELPRCRCNGRREGPWGPADSGRPDENPRKSPGPTKPHPEPETLKLSIPTSLTRTP